jgi:ABC-type proline/glycine betaine transport system substrate-binding protein
MFALLEALQITKEDQLEMLPAVEIDSDDPAAVAAKWVADHGDTWQSWLP